MLAQNPLLIDICKKLAYKSPDWVRITERFQRVRYLRQREEGANIGRVAEVHIRIALEDICRNNGDVVLDPIISGTKTKNYLFKRIKDGKLVILTRDRGLMCSDIDELLVADGLPVLFETKIKRYRGSGGQHISPGSRRIPHLIKPERIESTFKPFYEYFETDRCGYILVIPPEYISEDSDPQKGFRSAGGILVPFYTDRYSFSSEVRARVLQAV